MARPVLASTPAMDGIRLCPGLESLVVDAPEKMAQQALALLSGIDTGMLGQRGRECVLRQYNWGENLRRLGRLIEDDAATVTPSGHGRDETFIRRGQA